MRRKRANTPICRIDVSGLLCILLVLLFMFIAPVISFPDLRHDVADLPKVMHPIPQRGANREDALVFTVRRSGDFYLGGQLLRWNDDVPSKIREAVKRGAEKKVYIRADAHAKYKFVVELLKRIHSAGIENVAFLAEERKPS